MKNKAKDEQANGQTDFLMNTVMWHDVAEKDIFSLQKKIYDRYPIPVYFSSPVIII